MKNLKSNNEYTTVGHWVVILQVGNHNVYDFHYYEDYNGDTAYEKAMKQFKAECADAACVCATLTKEKRRVSFFSTTGTLFYRVDIKGTEC